MDLSWRGLSLNEHLMLALISQLRRMHYQFFLKKEKEDNDFLIITTGTKRTYCHQVKSLSRA